MKKGSGDVIILHVCTKNHDHMMYGSWDMECDRQFFFVILGHFLPFYLTNNPNNQNLEKKKKQLEKLSFYTCVPQMIICMVPEIWSMTDRIFCHYGAVFALLPPSQNKQKFKKWIKHQAILFYTSVPKMKIIWCMVPEIWSMTNNFFCHFGPFFALLSH